MKKYIYDYLIVGSGLFGSVFAQIMNETTLEEIFTPKKKVI